LFGRGRKNPPISADTPSANSAVTRILRQTPISADTTKPLVFGGGSPPARRNKA